MLLEFNFWLSRFRMPLLFFISGTVAYFMLKSKTGLSFIGLRFRRLFIPLLFGMLVVVPPQVYFERVTQGYQGSLLSFYAKVFEFVPYPKGNFSWHHLWFILYLFIYDVVFTPLFKWTFSEKGQRAMQKLYGLAKGARIYLLTIPGIILYTSLRLQYPSTHAFVNDWCDNLYYLQFLLIGFFCIANPVFMDSIERNRRLSFTIALLAVLLFNYVRWNDHEPWDSLANWRTDWRTYAFLALTPIMAWSWVLTGVGYGKRYLNKPHRVLDYVNQAVYPFYILHQTVIVILVYYVVQTTDTILMKYLFIVLVTFALTMSIYHLLIRPFAVTRFLFGMKPRKQQQKKQTKQAVNESSLSDRESSIPVSVVSGQL